MICENCKAGLCHDCVMPECACPEKEKPEPKPPASDDYKTSDQRCKNIVWDLVRLVRRHGVPDHLDSFISSFVNWKNDCVNAAEAPSPPSEGAREALEGVLQQWQDVVDGKRDFEIKTIGHFNPIDAAAWHKKDGIRSVVNSVREALSALPRYERRSCPVEACDKGNVMTVTGLDPCDVCDGTGSVYVIARGKAL